MADPYLQRDGQTLRNKLGIERDPDRLQYAETARVQFRAAELRSAGLPDAQGFDLVKAVHRHLFQDVYDWAGQSRTTGLSKLHVEGETARTSFTAPDRIQPAGEALFARIAAQNGLRGLSSSDFAEQLAQHFTALNNIHPFREGNGRTQRVVWEHVAQQAGHDLSFEGISRERMIVTAIAGNRGDTEPTRRMFDELLDPERRQALVTATRFLESARRPGGGMDWNDRYVATTVPGQTYSGVYAGPGGNNFMLGSSDRIYIGKLDDLPGRGAGLKAGAQLSFTAQGAAPIAPSTGMLGPSAPADPAAEHRSFAANVLRALEALQAAPQLRYQHVLDTHRTLFGDVDPAAGKDRLALGPDLAAGKAGQFAGFAHPGDIQRAVEYGLELGRKPAEMRRRPGEVLGLLAYAHPFVSGNDQTLQVVHADLARRAGFHIAWQDVPKEQFTAALAEELRSPGGKLDRLLASHIVPGPLPTQQTAARLAAGPAHTAPEEPDGRHSGPGPGPSLSPSM